MKHIGSFILGTVVGAAAGLVAAAYLLPDGTVDDLKQKVNDNDALKDLKEKYDNGTEIVKNQLSSLPNNVEDNSEIKNFDDIVIDNTDKNKNGEVIDADSAIKDLDDSEKN